MRKITSILMIALIALVGVGCDSNDDTSSSDSDTFIGTWGLAGVSDSTGDRTSGIVTSFSGPVTLVNTAAGAFTLTIPFVGADPLILTGTYAVNESAKTITLTSAAATLSFAYVLTGENLAALSADSVTDFVLGQLFATLDPPLGTSVVVTVQRAT